MTFVLLTLLLLVSALLITEGLPRRFRTAQRVLEWAERHLTMPEAAFPDSIALAGMAAGALTLFVIQVLR